MTSTTTAKPTATPIATSTATPTATPSDTPTATATAVDNQLDVTVERPPDDSKTNKASRGSSRQRLSRGQKLPVRIGIEWKEGFKLEAQDFQDKW